MQDMMLSGPLRLMESLRNSDRIVLEFEDFLEQLTFIENNGTKKSI